MPDVVVYGFHRSTYVTIAKLVLTHKGVPFAFEDLEDWMGKPRHLSLHPFNRVPILEHDGFRVYETSAIATYVDEAFEGTRLQPTAPQDRARMNQWISAVNNYYYPWIVYHLVHERLVFAELGIPADEKVVARALPEIARALGVLEEWLGRRRFLIVDEPTLADFYMLPSLTALGFTREGQEALAGKPAITSWLQRMAALESVQRVRASFPPPAPIEHARAWAVSHRPRY